MQPILNIAIRAARQSAEYIVQAIDRREPATSSQNSDEKLLSHLDEVVFNTLFDAMKRAHPTHFIYRTGESVGDDKEDTWEVCPLVNPEQLIRKLPETAFAMVHRHQGQAQNVLVVNPITGDEFTASRGKGAAMNDRRIRCSDTRNLESATVHSNLTSHFQNVNAPHALEGLLCEVAKLADGFRVSGSDLLDLCRTAAGQADAMLSVRVDPAIIAPAMLIARESGLLTGTLSGGIPKGHAHSFVAANPKLFKSLVQRFSGWEAKL